MSQVETTIMSEKGQVVIPRKIRKTLKLKPRTRFAVYAKDDTIVMKAFELTGLEKELSSIFKTIQAKNKKIGEKDVYDAIQTYRTSKSRQTRG